MTEVNERIGFRGRLEDEPQIRAGFIGCGSHSFRNLYPTLQFAPVELAAVCDLDLERAKAFARQFGAAAAYADFHQMLASEQLDAVFLCVGYEERGRPLYPDMAVECLGAGCHVWMEKPPAATVADVERVREAADAAGRHAMVGFKKMFAPANEKARALMAEEDFGTVQLALLQYPQHIPTVDEFRAYREGERNGAVGFLDHLCHPASLLVFLLGMPRVLHYHRGPSGAGAATFGFDSGAVASLAFTRGASTNAGMERTTIVGESGRHIVVDNNVRVTYHRAAAVPYGAGPDYFAGGMDEGALTWEPEFSLGQLYNKGLFLLGYYGEINEFARAILEGRAPVKGTLEHARQVTRLFEAFAEGPGREIHLD